MDVTTGASSAVLPTGKVAVMGKWLTALVADEPANTNGRTK
jgi:hypothetical protein